MEKPAFAICLQYRIHDKMFAQFTLNEEYFRNLTGI